MTIKCKINIQKHQTITFRSYRNLDIDLFNPDKFQVLAVGKKTYNKNICIHIQNSDLSCESTVKHLGIDIDYQLNFDTHIGNICRKASQQLNILHL